MRQLQVCVYARNAKAIWYLKRVAGAVKHADWAYALDLMRDQIGFYECLLIGGILCLLFLYSIGKPLCAVCFFNSQQQEKFLSGAFQGEGVVIAEPETAPHYQRVTVESEHQHILVLLNRNVEIAYGDRIRIKGIAREPTNKGAFDYQAYLAQKGIRAIFYYPSVTITGKTRPSLVNSFFYAIKAHLRTPILKNLPEPHAGLILAMTLGDTSRISPEFYDALVSAGIIHIVSISGLHIAIIVSTLFYLLILVGFYRKTATLVALPIIAFYIALVGSPAPAIRSGIMAMLVLLGYVSGRAQRSLYILLLAALGMLLWNVQWFFDISFQLSFAALAGLILVYPEIQKWFTRFSDNFIKDILIGSLAVELTLFPLIAHSFGRVSLVSPFINILILPVSAFWLILSLFVEITGFLWQPLSFLTDCIVRVVLFFGDSRFSSISFTPLPFWFIIVYYIVLLGGLYLVNYVFRSTFLTSKKIARHK